MQNDIDPLLRRQVQEWMVKYELAAESKMTPLRPSHQDEVSDIPNTEIFGYLPKK
jgi:hypothetical protein